MRRRGLPGVLTEAFFTDTAFDVRTVDATAFVLMLASAAPLDFVGGGRVAISSVLRERNKKEFHDLYPRAYLKGEGVADAAADVLVNVRLLPRASNNRIGDKRPSVYRGLMPRAQGPLNAVLKSALCPASLVADDFPVFVRDRAAILVKYAKALRGCEPRGEDCTTLGIRPMTVTGVWVWLVGPPRPTAPPPARLRRRSPA